MQERDFYFSKLREIELLCQQEGVKEQWDVMQHVENILYAATEEEGTQARLTVRQPLAYETCS
jgi:EB1-like C-terminal motif